MPTLRSVDIRLLLLVPSAVTVASKALALPLPVVTANVTATEVPPRCCSRRPVVATSETPVTFTAEAFTPTVVAIADAKLRRAVASKVEAVKEPVRVAVEVTTTATPEGTGGRGAAKGDGDGEGADDGDGGRGEGGGDGGGAGGDGGSGGMGGGKGGGLGGGDGGGMGGGNGGGLGGGDGGGDISWAVLAHGAAHDPPVLLVDRVGQGPAEAATRYNGAAVEFEL